MSRAIMNAQIEAEQDRQEAAFEQLPAEQQAAILEREAQEDWGDWKIYDTQDHEAGAAYYDGILTGK